MPGPVTGGRRSGLEVLVDGGHVEHHTLPVRPLGPHHLADVLMGSKRLLEPGWPMGSGPRPPVTQARGQDVATSPPGAQGHPRPKWAHPHTCAPPRPATQPPAVTPRPAGAGQRCWEAGGCLSSELGLPGPLESRGCRAQTSVGLAGRGEGTCACPVEKPQREAFRVGDCPLLGHQNFTHGVTLPDKGTITSPYFCLHLQPNRSHSKPCASVRSQDGFTDSARTLPQGKDECQHSFKAIGCYKAGDRYPRAGREPWGLLTWPRGVPHSADTLSCASLGEGRLALYSDAAFSPLKSNLLTRQEPPQRTVCPQHGGPAPP